MGFDTPLTQEGINQAKMTAKALALVSGITAIYASPLQRTYQTAQIINRKLQVPLITDRRIIEINHGSWEGKTVDQFDQDELTILKTWKTNPSQTQMPGGDHFNNFVKNGESFLADLEQAPGKTVIVTHDALIRMFVCKWSGWSYDQLWSFSLDNCGITTLGLNPREIIELNNTIHLNGHRSDLIRQAL